MANFCPSRLDKQTIVFPGFDGGGEWGGPALDPATDVLYVSSNEMAWLGGLVPALQNASPGATLYQSQCAMCHGVDRAGAPPAFPSLVGVFTTLSADQVTEQIKKGKGRMPSFPNLDDHAVAALLDYLRSGAPAANPTGVAEMRSALPVEGMADKPVADKAGAQVYADHNARFAMEIIVKEFHRHSRYSSD